jgi:hypothetical protein
MRVPGFDSWPDDTTARWELIRLFWRHWEGFDLGPARGGPSLEEWAAFIEDLGEQPSVLLRDIPEVRLIPELGVVSLMMQGEEDFIWAVKQEETEEPDPAVHGYQFDYETEEFTYLAPLSGRVTDWCLGHLRVYLSGEGFWSFGAGLKDGAEESALLDDLGARFSRQFRLGNHYVFEADQGLAADVFTDWASGQRMVRFTGRDPLDVNALPPLLQPWWSRRSWSSG